MQRYNHVSRKMILSLSFSSLLVAVVSLSLGGIAEAYVNTNNLACRRGVLGSAASATTPKGYKGTYSEPSKIRTTTTLSASSRAPKRATKKATKKAKKKSTKKSKSSKAAPVMETFKKSELITEVSMRTGLTKKDLDLAIMAALSVIAEQVADGKKVSLHGFGSFMQRHRAERMGRNPQTGEELVIPATKTPGFTASKRFKDFVNRE